MSQPYSYDLAQITTSAGIKSTYTLRASISPFRIVIGCCSVKYKYSLLMGTIFMKRIQNANDESSKLDFRVYLKLNSHYRHKNRPESNTSSHIIHANLNLFRQIACRHLCLFAWSKSSATFLLLTIITSSHIAAIIHRENSEWDAQNWMAARKRKLPFKPSDWWKSNVYAYTLSDVLDRKIMNIGPCM